MLFQNHIAAVTDKQRTIAGINNSWKTESQQKNGILPLTFLGSILRTRLQSSTASWNFSSFISSGEKYNVRHDPSMLLNPDLIS